MRRVFALLIVCLGASTAQAEGMLARMDRVECMSEGLLASATMKRRGKDQDLAKALGSARSDLHRDLVRKAHAEPIRPDRAQQAKHFADQAMRACRDRLYLERQQAMLDRVRSRNVSKTTVIAW